MAARHRTDKRAVPMIDVDTSDLVMTPAMESLDRLGKLAETLLKTVQDAEVLMDDGTEAAFGEGQSATDIITARHRRFSFRTPMYNTLRNERGLNPVVGHWHRRNRSAEEIEPMQLPEYLADTAPLDDLIAQAGVISRQINRILEKRNKQYPALHKRAKKMLESMIPDDDAEIA